MTRTKNSIKNITVALAGQSVGIVVSFIARIFFIRVLGTEYLGISGLFTNILTMLSLVELGIGPAIIFSLYKPLAEDDKPKVQALMRLYKNAYTIIGILVAALGLSITPFLHVLIKEMPNVPDLNLIFILFVINSAISYFYAYKRNLIIADQHRYIATIYRYCFFAGLNLLQIIFLYLTKSYIVFLILQIACTLAENIMVSIHADRMYPYLKEKTHNKLDAETVRQIKKNTGAMVLHKMGSIVISSTDNILISAKVGIVWVGLYSNYQLIINAIVTITAQFFTSITASIGNLGATESREKSFFIFECTQFANFWIYGFCSISLLQLFNPFIGIWLGNDLLMNMGVVTMIVINFYIRGMRNTVLTFTDAFGLYWYTRYKPIVEIAINLGAALSLAPRFGIAGIFMGTFISAMTISFWVEAYVLFSKGFKVSMKKYVIRFGIYTLATVAAGFITWIICELVTGTVFTVFVLKFLICLMVPNLIFLICFYRTMEFQYLRSVLNTVILEKIKKIKG
jgi:O-antigen/teichoic acid export membrane protein